MSENSCTFAGWEGWYAQKGTRLPSLILNRTQAKWTNLNPLGGITISIDGGAAGTTRWCRRAPYCIRGAAPLPPARRIPSYQRLLGG